jgi:hypothetical protein
MKMKLTIAVALLAQAVLWGQSDEPAICKNHSAPYNLIALGQDGDDVHLAWVPGDCSGVGFDIERSLDGVRWERINYGYTYGHYTDNYELDPSTVYYYRVRAVEKNGVCATAYSNTARARTLATVCRLPGK